MKDTSGGCILFGYIMKVSYLVKMEWCSLQLRHHFSLQWQDSQECFIALMRA